MRVGLLGGTFDPPHRAHLLCAQYTLEELKLDKVIFIPSGDHPFKREAVVASALDRYAMTKLAIKEYPKFELSDIEIRRTGITYTIDTIEALKTEHPDWDLYLLIGADNIADLNKWHRHDDLLKTVKLVVFHRATNEPHPPSPDFLYPDTPVLDISSTEIRSRIRDGRPIDHLVTPVVENYIEQKHLYR